MRPAISLLFSLAILSTAGADTDWPQFRGPTGNGHCNAKNLPVEWSESDGIKWKVAVHGRAWSSPVILGSQVWMTSATEDGKELSLIVVDKATGRTLFDKKLYDVETPQFAHRFNSYASPTPAAENGRVYVTWGSPATACLDAKTFKILWERRDLVCDHFRGAGSSPILFENLLIMNHDGADTQYVIALDKRTGKTVWQTHRSVDYQDLTPEGKPYRDGDMRKAFSTPHIGELDGKPILLSSGAKAHYAYDPRDGRELWRVDHPDQHSASTRPLLAHGLAYFPTGFGKGELIVVRADRSGALAAKDLAWHEKRSIPKKPSLLMVNDLLFMVDDGGIASCYEAVSGKLVWQERLAQRAGNFSASPLLADGRIYISNEEGNTYVFAADREFKLLATNALESGCMASPAISENAIFLRTKTHLYRIEK
jgi:outer membrane protein assembly factor BamB